MPTPAEIVIANMLAEIASIDAKRTSGMTQIKENDREMRFDMRALADRRAELVAQLGILTQAKPTIRRLLTYTAGKGL